MKSRIRFIYILIFLAPCLVWSNEECVSLKELSSDDVFPKSADVQIHCKFISEVESFRSAFISKYGEENWKKFKYMKSSPDEYGGVSLAVYDVNANVILDASSSLNNAADIFSPIIQQIVINDKYTFTKKDKKWLYVNPILNIGNSSTKEIATYIKVISKAKGEIKNEKSPYLLMKLIHDGITEPIISKKFGGT